MKRLADTFDASGAGRTLYLARAQSFVASLAGDG
jgi:hypothetical protein